MSEYSLAELAALSGLPARTIRYYIAEGLVPSPGREGPATRYAESTLARLRLINRLRDAHQPLAEIRTRLESLSDAELADLNASPAPKMAAESALDYIRTVLGEATESIEGQQTMTISIVSPRLVQTTTAVPAVAARSMTTSEPATPATVDRSQWERIALAPGIELHVRRPLSRRENRMVERLLAFARQLQGEDQL